MKGTEPPIPEKQLTGCSFRVQLHFRKTEKQCRKWEKQKTLKNRHCLRGIDEKYIQWNEIRKDVLNGKLKICQNKRTESDCESEEGEKEVE